MGNFEIIRDGMFGYTASGAEMAGMELIARNYARKLRVQIISLEAELHGIGQANRDLRECFRKERKRTAIERQERHDQMKSSNAFQQILSDLGIPSGPGRDLLEKLAKQDNQGRVAVWLERSDANIDREAGFSSFPDRIMEDGPSMENTGRQGYSDLNCYIYQDGYVKNLENQVKNLKTGIREGERENLGLRECIRKERIRATIERRERHYHTRNSNAFQQILLDLGIPAGPERDLLEKRAENRNRGRVAAWLERSDVNIDREAGF